jgi:uncharacterized membrane protein YcaP (DUF421 family)
MRPAGNNERQRSAVSEIGGLLRLVLGLGLESKELAVGQMALRAVVVYGVTLFIVRLGKKRFMGRSTAFDVILGVMLGSIASRVVTGNAPFLPALVAIAVLVAVHWIFSAIAFRSHAFGVAIKGEPRALVRDGEIDWKAMRAAHLTERDLWEELRRHSLSDLDPVGEACLERNGDISIVKNKPPPKVVAVAVADGVQTVRIELD